MSDKKRVLKKTFIILNSIVLFFLAIFIFFSPEPKARIIAYESNETYLTYEIQVKDTFGVAIDSDIKMILKDENGIQIDSKNLTTGSLDITFENLYIGFEGSIEVVARLRNGYKVLVSDDFVMLNGHRGEDVLSGVFWW